MGAKTEDDVRGLEYDWLGCDRDGRVALFSTAGGGFAPQAFLDDTDAHAAAIEWILRRAPSTEAKFAPKLDPGLENTWHQIAERGLYAFDSDFHGGAYRLVAAPKIPIHVSQLPPVVMHACGKIRFAHLSFDSSETISRELLQR